MNNTPSCPKCQTEMEVGFILDRGDSFRAPAEWVTGEPVPSFWMGTNLDGKKQLQIATFRCPKCGYLESYAKGLYTSKSTGEPLECFECGATIPAGESECPSCGWSYLQSGQ